MFKENHSQVSPAFVKTTAGRQAVRPGSQVARRQSAKLLCVGATPILASYLIQN